MRYEIDANNAISIWDNHPEPFQYQPTYPNGDLFDTREEAEAWAIAAIAAFSETNPYAPDGKGLAPRPKPTAEEKRELALSRTGLTVADLKALLGLV